MKVDLKLADGRQCRLTFAHVKDSRHIPPEHRRGINMFVVDSAMSCWFRVGELQERLDYSEAGWAFCSRREPDGFDPAKGRRKSLANALRRATRADRALVWDAFNAQFPPDREKSARRQALDEGWLGRLTKGLAI